MQSNPQERPILFSGEMVRAILGGRKTQTRHGIKPQPPEGAVDLTLCWPHKGEYMPRHWLDRFGLMWGENTFGNGRLERKFTACPYGQPGDHLWVRETWCEIDNSDFDVTFRDSLQERWIDYRATPAFAEPGVSHPGGWENAPDDPDALRWRPSGQMPRWASRITLEIVDVRVDRVQDISWDDCQAEGQPGYTFAKGVLSENPPDPRWWFIEKWNSLNAKRGFPWESNPYVWVVEFKKL